MDWNTFSTQVAEALLLLVATGAVGAAVAEFVKQAGVALHIGELPAEAASLLAALMSGGLCAYTLVAGGASWLIAVAATLVALYAPQPMHDALTKLKTRSGDKHGDQQRCSSDS